MATRIQHIVVDDLDGTDSKVGTYRFAFDGVEYEIDLADHNFDKLAATLRPYLAAARRLPKSRTTRAAPQKPGKNTSPLRQWWYAHQHDPGMPPYNPRGTIPHRVGAAKRAAGQP
jgi:hypothetical protein